MQWGPPLFIQDAEAEVLKIKGLHGDRAISSSTWETEWDSISSEEEEKEEEGEERPRSVVQW